MTFDDGMLIIYSAHNLADPGEMPITGLIEKSRHFYGYDNLGINRYYTALQAHQTIEAVVNIPDWNDITATDICALENGAQYRIVMIQPTTDEDRLKVTKLSLERVDEEYAIQN